MANIIIENVSKEFKSSNANVQALQDVSLTVSDGSFVAVVGPSGCGKSTLLNLIAGFDKPSKGRVLVNGKSVEKPGPDRAVVFQQIALFPWLTVEQNIAFGLGVKGVGRERSAELVDSLLAKIGLTAFRKRFPAELSGGMKQRVSIARVLALDSDVLLMDEPFGALDAQTRLYMQEFLLDIWDGSNKTVFFVTHDIEEAIYLSDKVFIMTARPGRIKEIIDVKLPRPRHFEILATPECHELADHALRLVREEVINWERVLEGRV